MLNEYIDQNYPTIFDLFADYTQSDEYSESELCKCRENERIQFAEQLEAAISTRDNDLLISDLIEGFSSVCYYAELVGFILGFQRAAAIIRESSIV